MDVNTIVEWIIAVLPSIIAVFSTVGLVWKVFRNFRKLKDDVSNMTAMEEVRSQLKEVLQENASLKKDIRKLVNQNNHVHTDGGGTNGKENI